MRSEEIKRQIDLLVDNGGWTFNPACYKDL